MSSQAKDDPFCLECHWEAFHIDGKENESSDVNSNPQWNCPGEEHHTLEEHCDVDEACCDVDDCLSNCGSVCDGFVDCDASTVCSLSHCEDQNCQSDEPVCFDEHCFGENDGVDHGLESFLGLDGPLALEATDLLSPTAVDHTQIDQSGKTTGHTPAGTVDPPHCTDAFFAQYPTPATHCHPPHHFHCHSFPQPSQPSDITNPSLPIQNEVNPADVFHMLGMCTDFSSCQEYHVQENNCQHNHQHHHHNHHHLDRINESSSSDPFSCFHTGHHHLNGPVKPHVNLGHTTHAPTHSHGPCRSHHRCRAHTHVHSHPYSPYSRQSRSSISSHLLSSPGETPPPLEGGTSSSVLTTPDFSPVDSELHICKWATRHHGIKHACGATFADAGALQEHLVATHMTTVDGVKGNGYYCCWEGCHRPDEPFSQKSKLQGHFLTHSNHKNFKCSVCGKFFARQATLDRHERSHRGEKPYSCAECGKSFTDSSELKTHSRTHTGEKPFKCTYPGCNFTTGDSSNMSSHRLTHGERRHKCHYAGCTKSFTRPDQLKRHLKTTHKDTSSTLPSPIMEDFNLSFTTIP